MRRSAQGFSYSLRLLRRRETFAYPDHFAFGVCAESPERLRRRHAFNRLTWDGVCYAIVRSAEGHFWDNSSSHGRSYSNRLDMNALAALDRVVPDDPDLRDFRVGDIVTVTIIPRRRHITSTKFEILLNGACVGSFPCSFEEGDELYAMVGADSWPTENPWVEFLT
eukprot:TRINITY_DN82245_c0_g1_i1.p1 TRINITY_DN82245_c0_g1~~TRINITY_DN82245_c0_g1_i1.p1  ORF type:complete len:179 (-),score=8.86 TRINITY_DN82245_c0_g1_i1:336-833(-)